MQVQKYILQLSLIFTLAAQLTTQSAFALNQSADKNFTYLEQPDKAQVLKEADIFYEKLLKAVVNLKAAAKKATGKKAVEISETAKKIEQAQLEIKSAKEGSKESLELLVKRLDSNDGLDLLVASYGIILTGKQTEQVLSKVHEVLKKTKDSKSPQRQGTVASLMSMIITFDSENSVKMLDDMSPFLDSENIHEVYWTLRALSSLKEKSFPLFRKVLALTRQEIKRPSIRRNALMTLSAMGPQIGTEGFAAIEDAYSAYSIFAREAAILASLSLKDSLPKDMKETLENDFLKPWASIVPLSITLAVLNDDLTELTKGYDKFPHEFIYTSDMKMLEAYFQYLGKDCLFYLGFAKKHLASSHVGQNELGAMFIVAMGKYAPADLVKKSLKILDES